MISGIRNFSTTLHISDALYFARAYVHSVEIVKEVRIIVTVLLRWRVGSYYNSFKKRLHLNV